MRLSESFFYLLLSSAKSHMVESWMFPPFEKYFHVYYASGAKKLCPELSWMSTVNTFSSPSCRSESIKLTMWLLHVELKRKALQLIVWAYFYFFFHDSCLMMMNVADPWGRWACRSFTPLLHFNAAHTLRAPSWIERGALQALNPPPSQLTCGTCLSSPRTPVEYTLGLTNYSLKTSGMWVVHNWQVSASGESSLVLRACVSEPPIHVVYPQPLISVQWCLPTVFFFSARHEFLLNLPHWWWCWGGLKSFSGL